MKPFVLDTKLEALEQELQVIGWLKDHFPKNKKKVASLARYLHPLVPEFIQKSICEVLMRQDLANPLKTLQAYIDEMDSVPKIIEGLKAEGNHGMIIHKQTELWGFNLVTNQKWLSQKDSSVWTQEQEEEIAREALETWMEQKNIPDFNGKVVLFSEYGFSGIAMVIPTTVTPECRAEMQERRQRQKVIEGIAKYI